MPAAVLVLAVAACCLCAVSSQGVTSTSAVPLFLWSEKSYFSDGVSSHVTSTDVVHLPEVSSLFEHLLSGAESSADGVEQYIATASTANTAPEVVLAFVHSKLGSAQASLIAASETPSAGFDFVGKALESSSSSLSLPYVVSSSEHDGALPLSLSDQLISSLSRVAPKAQIVAFQLGAEKENPSALKESSMVHSFAGCDALLTGIEKEGSGLFQNGRPDLLLVKTERTEDMQDDCLKRVTDYINDKTKGNFVSLLSADASSAPIQLTFTDPSKPKTARAFKPLDAELAAVAAFTGPQYVNAPIVTGLSVFFLILLVTSCALNCLMSIETPVRFASTPLSIGKEA